MRLTREDKNKIYAAIEESHLDPTECTIIVDEGGARINHTSGSFFAFYPYAVNRQQLWRVTADVWDGTEQEFFLEKDIEELAGFVYDWANEVQQVADTPDYWAEMQDSRDLIIDIQQTGTGNMPFTKDEQRNIEVRLQEITEQLKEQYQLTKEQTEHIDEWRDEVVEASTRMGRKDWLIYLLGTITALTIAATVPSGLGEHAFAMVIHALGHLFTGGSEPPRILA
jgi:hypothetical protein